MAPQIVSKPALGMTHHHEPLAAAPEPHGHGLHDNTAAEASFMDTGLVALLFDD